MRATYGLLLAVAASCLAVVQVGALETPPPVTQRCTSPRVRKEFRELTDAQKQAFIDANNCLRDPKKSPGTLTEQGSPTMYDDLVWVHSHGAPITHNTAEFLPWHRQFLGIYEYWLEKQCGYSDGIPYWDWSIDSQAPERSTILSPKWFGGNGDPNNDNCLKDGQLKDARAHFPAEQPTCIRRQYNQNNADHPSPRLPPFPSYQHISEILELSQDSYDEFRHGLEDVPHNLVHQSIGGDMQSLMYSTNDVLFFLHHANLDRLYAVWQIEHPDLAANYEGPRSQGNDAFNANQNNRMQYYNIYPDAPVKVTFSITGGRLMCYTYTNSVAPDSVPASDGSMPSNGEGDGSASSNLKSRGVSRQGFAAWRAERIAARADASPPTTNGTSSTTGGITDPASSQPFIGSPTNPLTPDPYDRDDKYNIRKLLPIPTSYLEKWGYSPSQIRRIRSNEALYDDFIDYVNAASGFVSHNALCYGEKGSGWKSYTADDAQTRAVLSRMLCKAANVVLSAWHGRLGGAVQGAMEQFLGQVTGNMGQGRQQQQEDDGEGEVLGGGQNVRMMVGVAARPVASW
ncbi:hypothetical protein HKX48_001720 [Thoreauomyces humboldtii]|nr:hypothetical protein HKX48_001720 [Thoreauomyces humboldtii]